MIDAVRVPPSACRTSQSIKIEHSPIFSSAVTARSDRPTSRWISWVRPDGRPLFTSRGVRTAVALGSIAYSAVTHPEPVPCSHRGAFGSYDALTSTRVLPISSRQDPSAHSR